MRRPYLIVAIFVVSLCLSWTAMAAPDSPSGITSFRSDVTVKENGTLDVREEIVVNDAASFYKHGFRHDPPISGLERWDVRYVGTYKPDNGVRAHILEVTEDGQPARYEKGSGIYPQLYVGGRNTPLDSGEHRFTFHYTVDSALKPGAQLYTLYWNSIGHERNVPIAEAILAIHLPAAIPAENVQVEPRVGGRGGSYPRGPQNTLERVDDTSGAIVYRATNLGPHQSLSLAVTWPSGYIHLPFFSLLPPDAWMFGAPIILFLYYLIAWFRIGPDPKPGTILTLYEPPEGLSPAATRYIASGITDGRSFAAVIAQLAVRGCIRVESANGKYKLSRLMSDRATESALAPEEKRILATLFEDGPCMELSPTRDDRAVAQTGRYLTHIHQELTKQLGGKYFTRHTGTVAMGVLITFLFAMPIAAMARGVDTTGAFMLTLWILFIGLTLGLLAETALRSSFRTALRARNGWKELFPSVWVVVAFGGIIFFLLKKLAAGVSISFAVMLVAFLLINLGWWPQLRRKSPLGRQTTDQIAGFRQFLLKTEQDRLDRIRAPEDVDQDLARHLPYAIALEVKEAWGDDLTQAFLGTVVYTEG